MQKNVEVYSENPLVNNYDEYTAQEDFYQSVSDISNIEYETANLDSTVVKLITKNESSVDVYIKTSDKNTCCESAFNWDKWFYDLNSLETCKDDIICDRTVFIEKIIEFYNKFLKNNNIKILELEKWWYGSKILNEYLKGIFGSNDKYEFAKTVRNQFQKAVCQHPLEWDKTLFNCDKIEQSYLEVTNTVLKEHIKQKLINESEKSDVWNGALQTFFKNKKNDFYFVNPLYFANHLDRAEVFGFNPYELEENRNKLIAKANFKTSPKGVKYGSNGGTEKLNKSSALNNPGCAPFVMKNGKEDYATLSGVFNEDYLTVARYMNGDEPDLYSNYRTKYHHFGVDFSAAEGTPVKSFIYGKVIAKGWISTNGRCLLIQRTSNNFLYLLCHLKKYPEKIKVGINVCPGDIVAYTGCSGVSDDICSETTFSSAPHLHVSVLKYDKTTTWSNIMYEDGKNGTSEDTFSWNSDFLLQYIDPFDYTIPWMGKKDK